VVVVTDNADHEIALCSSADLVASVEVLSSKTWGLRIVTAWTTGDLLHSQMQQTRLFFTPKRKRSEE
jgi:hypothetical protein